MPLKKFKIKKLESICKKMGVILVQELTPNCQFSVNTGEQLTNYWLEYNLTMIKGEETYRRCWKTKHEDMEEENLPIELKFSEILSYWKEDEEPIYCWLMANSEPDYKIIG